LIRQEEQLPFLLIVENDDDSFGMRFMEWWPMENLVS